MTRLDSRWRRLQKPKKQESPVTESKRTVGRPKGQKAAFRKPYNPKVSPKSEIHAYVSGKILERINAIGVRPSHVAEKMGKTRDLITKWATGQSLPEQEGNLIKLAEALETTPEYLWPENMHNIPKEVYVPPPPGYVIKSLGPDRCLLQVNQPVSKAIAYKILGLLDSLEEAVENEQTDERKQ